MRKAFLLTLVWAGVASAQANLDANSILVTANKTVVLEPTDATFTITVSADITVPMSQVLAAVDFGLTINDLIGINSYPMYGPYGATGPTRVNYTLRLTTPVSQIKSTVDKLEKLRKATDTGMDLSYTTTGIGPSAAAIDAAHAKALPDLMADARKRAENIAAASGLKLGNIQAVSENYYNPSATGGFPQPMVGFSATVRFAAQ